MKTVNAREANQAFSKLLADVERGAEVIITRHGKPVARMIPCLKVATAPEREAARKRLKEIWKRGYHLGGKPMSRDEMHERGR